MTTTEMTASDRYAGLVTSGALSAEELREAEIYATARGIELERVLLWERRVSRTALLNTLSDYHRRPYIEYDERMPIPPELLDGLDGERLSFSLWFPVIKDGDTVVIAANDPDNPETVAEVKRFVTAGRYEFWVALGEDIQWFIQDYLHAKPGALIGTERTGLAYWRNTMAQWRTRLACYRTDLAKGRTDLAFLRWGLGLTALSDTLMRTHKLGSLSFLLWFMVAIGLSLAFFGLAGYLKIRRSIMKPRRHETLVEVTAATLQFLENYHFLEHTGVVPSTKNTMLARLADFLADHCTILYPSPASRERTHLARERNVLAAQRTIAACFRTIYARARTGLAFIRTGVAFTSLGLGLMRYFGIGILSIFDLLLFAAGILMAVDGLLWYMPVRKEQAELPRCPLPEGR